MSNKEMMRSDDAAASRTAEDLFDEAYLYAGQHYRDHTTEQRIAMAGHIAMTAAMVLQTLAVQQQRAVR